MSKVSVVDLNILIDNETGEYGFRVFTAGRTPLNKVEIEKFSKLLDPVMNEVFKTRLCDEHTVTRFTCLPDQNN